MIAMRLAGLTGILGFAFLAGSGLAPAHLHAQDPGAGWDAPGQVLRFLNAPTTLRLPGGTRIPQGSRVESNVAVLGGSLVLGGAISGHLVVVNGDLEILPGARVDGDVVVQGGVVRGGGDASWLAGTLHLDPARVRYRIRGDVVEPDPGVEPELPPFLVADFGVFELRPRVRSAGAYNRVEGLPVEVGMTLETRSRNPLRVDAVAIWRSASGLEVERENLGYSLRIEQDVGGRGEARMGFELLDRISPIEDRGMSRLESSLSTFLLRRDLRDFYGHRGWSFYLEGTPLDLPLRPRLEYREEDHRPVPVRDPWTLRSAEREWRPQPLAAEGSIRTLAIGLDVDTRDNPVNPSNGWWIQGDLRRQVGGNLRLPDLVDPEARGLELFSAGELDLRRYARLGPEARLNARVFLAGSLNRVPLPPQYQRSLGGEGTLPGHRRFALDCGARQETVTVPDAASTEEPVPVRVYPGYGCDRVALARLEFQGRFPWSWSPGDASEEWEVNSLLSLRPAWSLFLGAGQGWSHFETGGAPGLGARTDSPLRYDMGVGLFVGPLGVYWAWPLNRRDRGLNFFVRLSHLF